MNNKQLGMHDALVLRSAERYRKAGEYINLFLNTRLASKMSSEEALAIEDALVAICFIDDAVDTPGSDATQSMQLVNYITDNTIAALPLALKLCADEVHRVRSYLLSLPPKQMQHMRQCFIEYLDLSFSMANTTIASDYATLKAREGTIAMDCILHLLRPERLADINNQSTFVWLKQLASLGNIVDSFFDAAQDITSERVSVEKPLHLRLALGTAALKIAPHVLRGTKIHELKELVDATRGVTVGTKK